MKTNNEKMIDKLVEIYINDFRGLSDKQQTLLAYRKIIEFKQNKDNLKQEILSLGLDEMEMLDVIIKASNYNAGILKSLILVAMCESNLESRDLYKKSLISYNRVLENYKLLAKELKIEDSLGLSHLLTYMLWGGYYSVSKKHEYRLQDRLLLSGMYSFDVIKGRGVCLAYAELLRNYLTVCDKKAAMLDCNVPTGKKSIICGYRPKIERNYKKEFSVNTLYRTLTFLLKGMISKTGNHAVTLIEENEKLFIYDPTNLYVLNVLDGEVATIVNGIGNYKIKPFSTLIMNPMADDNRLFERLFSDRAKEPAFNQDEIIDSFEGTLRVINNNISLLDDAYDNIHSELEVIDKQTDEIGGHIKSMKKIREMKKRK